MSSVLPPDAVAPSPNEATVALHRLSGHALACGLAAIVPIPFVDELVLRRLRRASVRETMTSRGIQLSESAIDHVAGIRRRSGWRRLIGLLYAASFKLAIKLIRRLFRSVLFFLAIKDAADAASDAFHRAYLECKIAERLAAEGRSESTSQSEAIAFGLTPEILASGWAIERTCKEVDTRAVQRVLKGTFSQSKKWLRRSVRKLRKALRGEKAQQIILDSEQEREGAELIEELSEQLEQLGYLDALEQRCMQLIEFWSDARFHQPPPPPPPQILHTEPPTSSSSVSAR